MLLKNRFDIETGVVLAKVSKEKQISLCGITTDQTEANFKDQGLTPADAILIAAALEFRGSLTQVLAFLSAMCFSACLHSLLAWLCTDQSLWQSTLRY